MPIETICQNCARKLRVGDEFAGRKARCPHCKNVYTVPQALDPQTPDSHPFRGQGEPLSTQPVATTGQQWRLRTEDGNVYGPVSKPEVDDWLTEGRITASCHLQREGELEWVPAAKIYPALVAPTGRPAGANPFGDRGASSSNPYATPTTANPVVRHSYRKPHRGGTILAFGIIGIACCIIFAPIAWVMGQGDLAEIRAGAMDPAGRSLTQAGMVLGIIGTLLLAVQIVFGVIGVLAN